MEHRISVVLNESDIASRVKEIAKEISVDFFGENLLCICVLKGGFVFMADLMKHINIPTGIGYMAVSSYKNKTKSSGDIRIILDLDIDITDKNIMLIDTVVDTGQTINNLYGVIKGKNPKSIRVCALIDKSDRREVPVQLDYVGFSISNGFLVGYGLDYAERYRNLPFVGILEEDE